MWHNHRHDNQAKEPSRQDCRYDAWCLYEFRPATALAAPVAIVILSRSRTGSVCPERSAPNSAKSQERTSPSSKDIALMMSSARSHATHCAAILSVGSRLNGFRRDIAHASASGSDGSDITTVYATDPFAQT